MLSHVRVRLYPIDRTGLNVAATNDFALFLQFYNVSTNCLEAGAEVVRSNRDTSAKSWQTNRVKGEGIGGGGAASLGPAVEHVAFSSDGKVMKNCFDTKVLHFMVKLFLYQGITFHGEIVSIPRYYISWCIYIPGMRYVYRKYLDIRRRSELFRYIL